MKLVFQFNGLSSLLLLLASTSPPSSLLLSVPAASFLLHPPRGLSPLHLLYSTASAIQAHSCCLGRLFSPLISKFPSPSRQLLLTFPSKTPSQSLSHPPPWYLSLPFHPVTLLITSFLFALKLLSFFNFDLFNSFSGLVINIFSQPQAKHKETASL